MPSIVRAVRTVFRQLKYGLAGRVNTAPVKYKNFSRFSPEEFDQFVAERTQHAAKERCSICWNTNRCCPRISPWRTWAAAPAYSLPCSQNAAALRDRVQYTGLDVSENALAYCRSRYPKAWQFVQRDVLREGMPQESVDVVVVHEVVEHMPHFQQLFDVVAAAQPCIFALAGFAIDPSRRWNSLRWLRPNQSYMNYYAFSQVHDSLRRLCDRRPLVILDLGSFDEPENRFFPVKTLTVFYGALGR